MALRSSQIIAFAALCAVGPTTTFARSIEIQAPATPSQPPEAQTPAFRSGAERIVIDAAVVDQKGEPISGLTANDFTLTIDGAPRRVLSAEFIHQAPAATTPLAARRLPYSTNETAVGGRLVLLAFDLEGIAPGGGRDAAKAAADFIDRLGPADQVGLLSFPNGVNLNFTSDRVRVREALSKIAGRGVSMPPSIYSVGIDEAFQADSGNTFALTRAVDRECAPHLGTPMFEVCRTEITRLTQDVARTYRQRASDVSRTFAAMLQSFRQIDAPKTVVWISEGLPMPFGEGQADLGRLTADAAAARTTVYALHLDRNSGFEASVGKPSPSAMEDRGLARQGLDLLAGVTRGTVLSSIGTGSNAFDRIAREMTAYYLLSAEPEAKDQDGGTHKIKVTLARPGVTVRARRDFAVPVTRKNEVVAPEQAVFNVLRAPLLATEVPLKVATYSMRVRDDPRLRLVISAEVGRDAKGPEQTALGFSIVAPDGKVMATAFREATISPLRPGQPGPLLTTSVAEVPPGDYTLKLAVVDAHGRRGSVEHPVKAALTRVGALDLADLLLTPPETETTKGVRIVADPTINGQPFDAYLEAYGSVDPNHPPGVTIEIAESDSTPPLAAQPARVTVAPQKDRLVADGPLPLALLPPGDYVARAVLTLGGTTARQVRSFTLARAVPADDLFKAELVKRVGSFHTEQVLTATLVNRALQSATELGETASPEAVAAAAELAAGVVARLDRLTLPSKDQSLLAEFLRGLAFLKTGAFEDAAKQFRASVRASPDFLAGILYLGACYAGGGKTKEAVGAWQTSLVADDSSPEVFALVADGYLRMGDAEGASGVLDEAGSKWPEDERFVVRAALARAAAGHAEDALKGLMPAIERSTTDPEILALAVNLALASLASQPPADQRSALPRLQDLGARLRATNSPMPPLVERWLRYLESAPPSP